MTQPTDKQVEVAWSTLRPGTPGVEHRCVTRDDLRAALAAAQAETSDEPTMTTYRQIISTLQAERDAAFAAGIDAAIKAGMNLLDTDTLHSSQVDLWRSAIHDYLRAICALQPSAETAEYGKPVRSNLPQVDIRDARGT